MDESGFPGVINEHQGDDSTSQRDYLIMKSHIFVARVEEAMPRNTKAHMAEGLPSDYQPVEMHLSNTWARCFLHLTQFRPGTKSRSGMRKLAKYEDERLPERYYGL